MITEENLAKKFIGKGFWLYLFTFLSAPLAYKNDFVARCERCRIWNFLWNRKSDNTFISAQ